MTLGIGRCSKINMGEENRDPPAFASKYRRGLTLIEVALVLFGITVAVNAVARLLIAATTSRASEVRG